MNDESFIYTISNREVKNGTVDPIEYELMVGGFNSPDENFRFELLGFNIETNFDFTNDLFIIIGIENLASNGVFSKSILGANTVLIPIVLNNNISSGVTGASGEYKASGGSNIFFNVSNCRISREVKIRVLNSSLDPISINVDEAADWLMTFKVTPI